MKAGIAPSFYGPRPQPDYSVGFGRSAFTDDQLEKLKPFVGEVPDTFTSSFMATWQMYFPFLTCEVKCGAAALDVADRQNAHSMTLAVRGVVELFRLVKARKGASSGNPRLLNLARSPDSENLRPLSCNRRKQDHLLPPSDPYVRLHELDGKEKWTAYKFTKNVYDIWMPTHLKRICSVIDDLPPDLDFEVSQQSEPGESGLSQGLESHHLSDQSSHDAASLEEADSQSSRVGSRDVTPDTSLSQRIEGGAFKKPKKRGRPG
jgi:hypothetical protein